MRTLLPALVAGCALVAIPAAAQTQWSGHTPGSTHVGSHVAFTKGHDDHDDDHDHDHGFRDRADVVAVTHTYGGQWALYNNRSWAPNSYNDWWHDRPDRAYPRWLQNNQDCERVWWSGGGWRC